MNKYEILSFLAMCFSLLGLGAVINVIINTLLGNPTSISWGIYGLFWNACAICLFTRGNRP